MGTDKQNSARQKAKIAIGLPLAVLGGAVAYRGAPILKNPMLSKSDHAS